MNSPKKLSSRVSRCQKHNGFALIIALTLMSFMVVLILSLATFLNVEMHTSTHQNRMNEARSNALFGAQIALGQLQMLAGPDQRVTAPATVAYPQKTGPGAGPMWDMYRDNATSMPHSAQGIVENWKTFLKEDYDNSLSTDRDSWEEDLDTYWSGSSPEHPRHPHWLGVWESESRVTQTEKDENPDLRLGDFKRDQAPHWLVSGNENRSIDQQYTPDNTFENADAPSLIKLVGYGSAAGIDTDSGEVVSTDGMDGAVLAPLVDLLDQEGVVEGQYAYWVADESMKANFSILDPYFDNNDPGSLEYRNRLQVPQRLGWEQIGEFATIFDEYDSSMQKEMQNSEDMEIIETTDQISLIDIEKAEKYSDASRQAFHHITGFSKGIFTDTARGGLKQDLTVFLEDGNTGSDLIASNPIPNPDGNDIFDYANDPRMGPVNNGFPATDDNIPTWQDIKDWYDNEATGAGEGEIDATTLTGPVLTQFRLFAGLSYETSDASTEVNLHILPQVVLWNPYDAGLKDAEYEIRIKFHPVFRGLRFATELAYYDDNLNKTKWAYDPDLYNGQKANYTNTWRYYMDFDKNEREGITVTSDHFSKLIPYYYHTILPTILPGRSVEEKWEFSYNGDHPNLSPALSLRDVNDLFFKYNQTDPYEHTLPPESLQTNINLPYYNLDIMESEDSELRMTIDTAFEAGETLIFTANDEKINTSGGGQNATLKLVNEFSEDQPASGYMTICTISNPQPDELHRGEGAPSMAGIDFKRFAYADSVSILPEGFTIEIYLNGELYQEFDPYGSISPQLLVNFNGNRNPFTQMDQPMVWRRIYSKTNFDENVRPNSDTNRRISNSYIDNSLFGLGEAYIEPTYFRGTSPIDKESAGTTYRPFANYNVMARQYSQNNPVIDEIRHPNDWGNRNGGDGYTRFNSIIARVNTNSNQPPIKDFFNPDDNIAEGKSMSSGGNASSDGEAIHDVGNRWNANNDGELRAEEQEGNIRSFSLLQHYKLRDGLSRKPNTKPEIETLGIMPVRLTKRPTSNIVSLGQLQQVNLSPFMWQPANPIGNSEANAYVDRQYITGIHRPIWAYYETNADGTVFKTLEDEPVRDQRWLTSGVPNNDSNHLVDMSYLLNDALWDRYFLSTIPQSGSLDVDDSDFRLANSRIRFETEYTDNLSDYRDFNTAAAHLYNVGAFNVNSTSVEAWKALLTAFRDLELQSQNGDSANPDNTMPIARTLDPLTGPVGFTFGEVDGEEDIAPDPLSYGANPAAYANYEKFFGGYRYLTDPMIQTLAERIVDEVRLRGPFHSMSDFVNRRLTPPDGGEENNSSWMQSRMGGSMVGEEYDSLVGLTGINGALQRAINVSGINGGVNYPLNTPEQGQMSRYDAVYFPLNYSNAHTKSWGSDWRWFYIPSIKEYLDSENRAGAPIGEQGALLSHAPGFVTQADLLSMLGPVLTARGDTFLIRSYGSSVNKLTGEVDAEAWLELTVQRVTKPVNDDNFDMEPDEFGDNTQTQVGRKFEIVNFRWLTSEDV